LFRDAFAGNGGRQSVHLAYKIMNNPEQDEFKSKGAVEQDRPEQPTNTSLAGQMGHRDKGPVVDTQDTDFPEPGQNPEHSGELMEQKSPKQQNEERERLEREADQVQDEGDQQPGDRQRRNQNEEKDDPLAA
jgi:hypothetical protein